MTGRRLTKLEFQIMEVLWSKGECAIREVLESLPGKRRPAYTTIQTSVYRMESKGFVRRVKKVGNVHVFAPSISRDSAERTLIDELLSIFGGRSKPVMARLIESGKLSLEDVKEAERALQKAASKEEEQ